LYICLMNDTLHNTSTFAAYLAYHGLLKMSELKATDSNFSAVVETPYIDSFKDIFTSVERVKVSVKKHGLNGAKNLYKVYLNRKDLVKPPVIIRRKNGKPDMRFHGNVLAIQQVKINAFFGTTVKLIKEMKITNYSRILVKI